EEVLLAAAPELVSAAAAVVVAPGSRLVVYYVLKRQGPSSGGVAAETEHLEVDREAERRETSSSEATSILLRLLCEERLPPHMVPSLFLRIPVLPTTGTGKVSRRELSSRPLPPTCETVQDASEGEEGQACLDKTESLIAEAWGQVLGVTVTSLAANFLILGGDSMAALRVCQQLAQKAAIASDAAGAGGIFGEMLPEALLPAALLRRPRLADFARHLQETMADHFTAGDDSDSAALSTAQILQCQEVPGANFIELLHHSAGAGAAQVVRHVLQRGVPVGGWYDVDKSRRGRTPLHAACANGRAEVVKLLLEAAASISASDSRAVQPLHLAAQGGSKETLSLLIVARAKLEAVDSDRQTALHFAARAGAPKALVDVLLEQGARVGNKPGGGKKAGGGATLVQPSVDGRDSWGRSALHWAVVNGHRTMVSRLLEAGADRNLSDSSSETPLQIAERRAQCTAKDRPEGLGASVFGDIATLLGGSASTARPGK
ncbi:unnamed protein product, partial [Polarella glacialis]